MHTAIAASMRRFHDFHYVGAMLPRCLIFYASTLRYFCCAAMIRCYIRDDGSVMQPRLRHKMRAARTGTPHFADIAASFVLPRRI